MARGRERGAALVLVVIGMLALLAMAGLALDTAHVLLNKSRLQSALDAAALAAAKSLSQSTNTTLADTVANGIFTANLAQYPELQRAVSGGLTLTTHYSSTLIPFNPGSTPASYVQASITGFQTQMSLISVLGITSVNVAGSAVAGPSPALTQACNIVPIAVCSNSTPAPLYGYTAGEVVALNQTAGNAGTIGPGNYGLLALGGSGAAIVRTNLAGDYAHCGTVGNTLTTEPGVAAGPVSQGINTRFDDYKGGLSAVNYPPDVINSAAHQTTLSTANNGDVMQGGTDISTIAPANQAAALTFNYANYQSLLAAKSYDTQPLPTGAAAFGRRVIAAPLANCTGQANGQSTVQVNGFACFFLLQALGSGSNDTIYAQVLSGCDATGKAGPGAGSVGPFVIELYKSAGSPDS
jgi:hypothetical protein